MSENFSPIYIDDVEESSADWPGLQNPTPSSLEEKGASEGESEGEQLTMQNEEGWQYRSRQKQISLDNPEDKNGRRDT